MFIDGLCINKHKKEFGQFFTTNVFNILSGFEKYIKNKNVVDPFCGNSDLLKWAINNGSSSIKGYDVDEKYVDGVNTFYNDSIKNPLNYDFVLTNPPYLYIRDGKNTTKHTDLYQLALESIINSNEGIVIVPINFLSAENSKYIRVKFLEKFNIEYCRFFTEQVFDDTTYNVIAFYYKKKKNKNDEMTFILNIQPDGINKSIKIYREFNWQIGGEFIELISSQKNKLEITRMLEKDVIKGNIEIKVAYNHLKNIKTLNVNQKTFDLISNNIIVLKAIDTGTEEGKICLENINNYNLQGLISLQSSRNQIQLIFQNQISIKEQKELIELFNRELNKKRTEYFSLFMTNFRDNNRKRISFEFVYKFLNYLYFNTIKGEDNARQYSLFEAVNQ